MVTVFLPEARRRFRPACFNCAIGLTTAAGTSKSRRSTNPSTRQTRRNPDNCVAGAQLQPLHRPQAHPRLLGDLPLRQVLGESQLRQPLTQQLEQCLIGGIVENIQPRLKWLIILFIQL